MKKNSAQRMPGRETDTFVLLAAFAALLISFIWGATLYIISVERAATERAAIESSHELIDTYEAQMVRSLRAIDQTLKTVQYAYDSKNHERTLLDLKQRGLLPSTLVFGVSIADQDGNIVQSTRQHASANVAGQTYFEVHREEDCGVPFVDKPLFDADSDQWDLHFSRRLNAPDGGFAGVVFVSVDPAYFTSGYERSRMGESGVLGLLGTDGIFRVKRSGDNVTMGDVTDVSALFKNNQAGKPVSPLTVHAWDNVVRYANVRRLHSFPLIAIVGLSVDEQMAEFHLRKKRYLWQGAIVSVLLLGIGIVLSYVYLQMAGSRRRLRRVQETFYAASEASLDGFFLLRSVRDNSGTIVDFVFDDMNSCAEGLIGTPKHQILGRKLCEMFPICRTNGVLRELRSVAVTGQVREKEWKNHELSIRGEWLHREVVRVEDGVVAIVRDISERKRAELLRVAQGQVLEMIASSTPLQEVLANLVQLIEFQAPHVIASVRLLDKDEIHLQHAAGQKLSESYTRELDRIPVNANVGSCSVAILRGMPIVTADILIDPLWSRVRESAVAQGLRSCWSTPIVSHQGKVLGTLALYTRDVYEPTVADMQLVQISTRIAGIAIERRRAEERIRHMAHHDALTGLPNRVLLDDCLKQAILDAKSKKQSMLVALIDLDGFKLINDSLGHNIGDELLQVVSERMVRCVQGNDTVARLGGDEFVVILHERQLSDDGMTPTLQKISDAVAQPLQIGIHSIQVTCSIGVAMYPDDGSNFKTLLRNADAAMYRAKELGHNRCEFYTEQMNTRLHEKLELQEGLRGAIFRDEFLLLYQPQIDLRSGKVLGVEALIRWQHPSMGMVSPLKFIALAEETGLIVPVGDWVIHEACVQNKAWQDAGLPPITMSVNVSARQFREKNLVERVAHALQESGLEPRYLELELTESLIMQDMQRAISTMRELQAMGVHLSIDDFGTGYSSLSALKSFPISRLKLDRSFVCSLPEDDDDKVIASAVISLGHKLDLRVIAEGVETTEQLAFLRDNGCDEIQGNLISEPVVAGELEQLLAGAVNWLSADSTV